MGWGRSMQKPTRWVFKGSDCLQKEQNTIGGRVDEEENKQITRRVQNGPKIQTQGCCLGGSSQEVTPWRQESPSGPFWPSFCHQISLLPLENSFLTRFEPPCDIETYHSNRPPLPNETPCTKMNKIKKYCFVLWTNDMSWHIYGHVFISFLSDFDMRHFHLFFSLLSLKEFICPEL